MTKIRSLSGWGRFPKYACDVHFLNHPVKHLDGLGCTASMTPRGMGRSYGDAALSLEDGVVIHTQGLDRFLSFDSKNGVVQAMAGVTLEDILNVSIPAGWFLPVVPGTRYVCLGGAVASNVHGKNHHHAGALSNFVDSIEVLTERGLLTCSATHQEDLFNATLGGFGMTGLIQRVTLRLKRITSCWIASRCIRVANLEEAMGRCRELDDQYEYSVVWMDTLATGAKLGRGIVMVGNHLSESDLSRSQSKKPLHFEWKKTITCPTNIPEALLSPWSLKSFNQLYYHRFLGKECHQIIPLESWFFPLDSIGRWNRLYGSSGFVQYQFVLPHETAYQGMRKILHYLANQKLGSFLSVLKRVREDTVMLPFAVPGFTLALDIPLRHDAVLDHLDTLDQLVLTYGGRIYLAKDARMKPESFRNMYPQVDAWLAVVDHYNSNRRFYSRMGKRLKL